MQSYSYQSLEQQEKEQYKQELGLRKMLYKYQHENQQLKNQIKALTQRLQSILSQKNETQQSQNKQSNNPQAKQSKAHQKYLSEQMTYYFKRIQQINLQIKNYKQALDNNKQLEFVQLSNLVKDKNSKLQVLKAKLDKFKLQSGQNSNNNITKINQNQTNINGPSQQFEIKLINQLADLKKKLRDLQKTRNNNSKMDINRHMNMVNLEGKTRKLNSGQIFKQSIVVQDNTSGPGKKGLWGLDLTQENYRKIAQQFEQLKRQKNVLVQSIKVQNNGLKQRLTKLKNQYIDLSANANINQSVNLSVSKLKQSNLITPKQKNKQTIALPDIPVPLGNSAYERKNDKNFVQKKIKLIQWNLNKGKKNNLGFSWNDQNSKSPITGINIWLDKFLIGLQFIHTLGQTMQHLHVEGDLNKKLIPIQYRLNSNDYLQNIILVIPKNNGKTQLTSNSILGIQLYSKNGRKDSFGLKIGSANTQKFDFGIKNPEKPIYSFGSFIINSSSHLSCISSLGFAVI